MAISSSLEEAIERYQSIIQKNDHLDVYPNITWEEVLGKAKAAEAVYQRSSEGPVGFPTKIIRAVGDYAPAFKSWTQIIPDGKEIIILKAGFNIIFEVNTVHLHTAAVCSFSLTSCERQLDPYQSNDH
jgi:hypothetical protein